MALQITLPDSEKVARCRWPRPDFRDPIRTATMVWGRRAWEWMAAWCPLSLAQIPDPIEHFAHQDQLMKAEELRILDNLRRQPPTPGRNRFDQAQEAVWAEWVRVRPEVDTPVWSRTWEDTIRFTAPLRREEPDRTRTTVGTEKRSEYLSRLAIEALLLWTQDPDDDGEYGTMMLAPSTMQHILDYQIPPLYRHLIWDTAARRARETFPNDPRYTQLRAYPSPPY